MLAAQRAIAASACIVDPAVLLVPLVLLLELLARVPDLHVGVLLKHLCVVLLVLLCGSS